jgi:alcohol dehydrogenase class IV
VPKDAVPIPVIAIPTTAGTGSEVSPFAVFWDKTEKKKHSLMHAGLFPAEALVDPELTYSMPPAVTASAGMDAFTQACEAYWNRDHLPLSDDYALAAICRIRSALPKAVRNGDDKEARREMMLGSLEAGLAFSNTRTAACHSISYPMTAHFGVSHGQAVGITLPQVLILNAGTMPERAGRFLESMNSDSMDDAADKIRKMMVESGLKTRLSELKIKKEDIDLIVKEGFTPERMGNNPYVFNPESLKKLLLSIL